MLVRRVLLILTLLLAAASGVATSKSSSADVAAVLIAAGGQHTCASTTSVRLLCWGWNVHGQLGDGTYNERRFPGDVNGVTGVVSVAGGLVHTCAVVQGGAIKCWGLNFSGQVGDGHMCPAPIPGGECVSPTDVCSDASCTSPLVGGLAVAAGEVHSCALLEGGALKCWGSNSYGVLGNNYACGGDCTTPVDVVGLSSGIAQVGAGPGRTCAVTDAAGVKCWGRGPLGQGYPGSSPTPLDVVGLADAVQVAVSFGTSCAVTTSGGLKCWGDEPAEVLPAGSGVLSVTAGYSHLCVLMETGAVKCWGDNRSGQLGTTTGELCPPTPVTDQHPCSTVPVDVPGLGGAAIAVAGGFAHTCAVLQGGGVRCWGANGEGQLGCGFYCGPRPVDVTGLDGTAADADRDGCADKRELGLNETIGGRRDPTSPWDFYDTPDASNVRDRAINIVGDILRVAQRFGANDAGGTASINRNTDPLSGPPPAAPAYHPAFDRGRQIGPDPWDRAPPDGAINIIDDILGVVRQFGHSCI